jgi:hypothetical protein
MPSPKQIEKMAAAKGRRAAPGPALARRDDLPPEYWQALLEDVSAEVTTSGSSSSTRRLNQITQHLLRVCCRRCGRTVEIQRIDAVRLHGERAVWREAGQRLLDDTCMRRTGRHEEDGCWQVYEGS